MSNRIPQYDRYGDYGFRESCMHLSSEQVRKRVDDFAQRSIRKSIATGVSVKRASFNWPWLRDLKG
jgi:hypothetical protein